MPLTPISGANAYATPQDFRIRFDTRTTGDLVTDDGTQVTANGLLTDQVLLVALAEASGEVESACMIAGRYDPADLYALNGNSQQFLIRIVCAIAAQWLYNRRWLAGDDILGGYQWAQQYLTMLTQGARIFAFAETVAAGLPKDQFMTNPDFDNLNLVSGLTRMMGIRQDRKRGFYQ